MTDKPDNIREILQQDFGPLTEQELDELLSLKDIPQPTPQELSDFDQKYPNFTYEILKLWAKERGYQVIVGVLDPWFETGTEGVVWAVDEDGKPGYEGLHILSTGDHLTIYAEDKHKLFSGTIAEDRQIGWAERNSGYGQPSALGYWIHWTQAGFQPDDWASLFFHEPPYKAMLVKAANS